MGECVTEGKKPNFSQVCTVKKSYHSFSQFIFPFLRYFSDNRVFKLIRGKLSRNFRRPSQATVNE